jgi:ABC-2 type transport system permease protein
MSGHRVAAITRRLMQGFRRDRRTLALLFVAPLVILGLLGYLIRGSNVPSVGVANVDQGQLGPSVASALQKSSLVHATSISAADGDARLKDGSLAAYIVLPAGFSQQAQSGLIAPEVHLEGSQPGQSGAVLQALQVALGVAVSQAAGGRVQINPRKTYL